MPMKQVGNLHMYQFESLSGSDISHGILSRRGGVSPDPWRSLNVGAFIGDESGRVMENVRRSFEPFGRSVGSKHDVWQVHGAQVHVADSPRGDTSPVQADILITKNPEVSLFMRFADCVPIMIYDPKQRVIAMAHAGWKGVTHNAPGKAIRALKKHFGSDPGNLLIGLGPAVCGECYPVGLEVADGVRRVLQGEVEDVLWQREGNYHLDLPKTCYHLLEREGVREIEMSHVCTAGNLDVWYSHRGEKGRTGRFGALLALKV